MQRFRRFLFIVTAVLVPLVLLAARIGGDPAIPARHSRYWQDMHLSLGLSLYGRFPLTADWNGRLIEAFDSKDIRFHEFWKTVPFESFREQAVYFLEFFGDPGRSVLLALGFLILGGVSPYLLFWITWIFLVPVFLLLARAFRALPGKTPAWVFLALAGTSGFFAGTLRSAYTPAGFYLAGVLLLAAYALDARFGKRAGRLREGALDLLYGALLAIATLCRSGTLLLLPGFFLSLAFRERRRKTQGGRLPVWRRGAAFLAGCVLLAAPYAAGRGALSMVIRRTRTHFEGASGALSTTRHPLWHALWCGLGDFGAEKGFAWSDRAACDYVARVTGQEPVRETLLAYMDPEHEQVLRDRVLRAIRRDPAWFLGVLGRRFRATVFQTVILPWEPWSGRRRIESTPGENYYRLAPSADEFLLFDRRVEFPVFFFAGATWLLLAVSFFRGGKRVPTPVRKRLSGYRDVLLCLAAGTLAVPVGITTAGAIETQAFMVVYYLGTAFAAGEAVLWFFARWRAR